MTTTKTNTITCSNCGESNLKTDTYCSNCKARINYSIDPTPIPKVTRKTRSFSGYYLTSFIIAIFTMSMGLYKLFFYDLNEIEPVNAYVGADAYNYIINANYATAYFVLTILFVLIGFGFLFIQKFNEIQNR